MSTTQLIESRTETAAPTVLHPCDAEVLSAFGDTVHILLSGALTNDTFCIVRGEAPPHNGPPPHVHHSDDETFIIQKGRFEFWIDGETIETGPGDVVYGPRGYPHTFRNLSDEPSSTLVVSVAAGFESFFRQCSLAWGQENAMPQIMAISAAHDVEFLDPVTTPKIGAHSNGKTPRVVRAGQGETFRKGNNEGRILVSERDSAGEFVFTEINVAPGSEVDLGDHLAQDKAFIVRSGSFEVVSQGQQQLAEVGDIVWLPRDIAHSLRCGSAGAGQLLAVFLPGVPRN